MTVVLLCGQPQTPQSREMLSRLDGTGVSILNLETEPYIVSSAVKEAQLFVDAVYGIGFHGEIPDYLRGLFRLVNAAGVKTIAIDVPSGMDADSGLCDPDTLRADVTVTFTAMKPGLLTARASSLCGQIEVVSIGIDPRLLDQFTSEQTIIDWDMVASCFPPRAADSHKGTYGTVLSLCGSYGMAGAAILAARARPCAVGRGWSTRRFPAQFIPLRRALCRRRYFFPCPKRKTDRCRWTPCRRCVHGWKRQTRFSSAAASAPIGKPASVTAELLGAADCPIVLDADGINCAAQHIDIRKTIHAPLVLTPHPGEMARLLGCSIPEVQENRLEAARRFAEETGTVLVLKGHRTVIAAPGQSLLVNTTGNPGMATGGSGDVLAGMIASFLAQGMEPFRAAMCAVHLHGLAGDRAAARLSQNAMLPSDLLDELGGLFSNLENRRELLYDPSLTRPVSGAADGSADMHGLQLFPAWSPRSR